MVAHMIAMQKANAIPTLEFSSDKTLRKDLRKRFGKKGMLLTAKLSEEEANRVRESSKLLPGTHIKEGDLTPVVIDTGASNNATGFDNDFVKGTLKPLRTHLTWTDRA